MRSCQTFLAVTLHYNSSNNCPKPSFTRSCVGCWLVPNPFSVCVMLSNGLQSLKCVISLECEPLHVSDVTDTCTRRQRSGPVSEVPQVINNCHWGHLTCSCTALWQWIAATFIIWNGLRKSPADGKTESPLLTFLVAGRVFVTMVTKTAAHCTAVQLQLDPDKDFKLQQHIGMSREVSSYNWVQV